MVKRTQAIRIVCVYLTILEGLRLKGKHSFLVITEPLKTHISSY